jgi:hypothetical protein
MAKQVLEQLELVDVKIEDKKATLTFLDADNGEIREVSFNKQVYDKESGKFIDDEEKAKKVEEWCQDHFGLTFENLGQAVGDRKDIYCYDNFNSLFEVAQVAKFEEDMIGQIMSVEITEVIDDGQAVKIRFEYDGETYESPMRYSKFIESQNKFLVDSIQRKKKYDKFKEKFNIDISDKDQLVGKTVMVEIKKWAFNGKSGTWIDVKPFPKKKK